MRRKVWREADVPTEQPEAEEGSRIPASHADPGGSRHPQGSPAAGANAPVGLTGRVRDRETFAALARAPSRRVGPLRVRSTVTGAGGPPRVAYAIGRDVGTAVDRNRARRRLRAAVTTVRSGLRPGRAYLISADRRVLTISFDGLCRALEEATAEDGRP